MNKILTTALTLIFTLLILSCSSARSPYNDPDAQRERAKQAQDEMRRDMSK